MPSRGVHASRCERSEQSLLEGRGPCASACLDAEVARATAGPWRSRARSLSRAFARPALATALALCALFALSACGGSKSSTGATASNPSASSSSTSASPGQPANASASPNDPATIILPSGPAASHTVLATVAGKPITAAEVQGLIVQKSGQAPVPDPPRYPICIAKLKAEAANEASPSAKALKGRSESQLREVCREHYEEALRVALGTAIHNRWLSGEAVKDQIHIGERAVQEEFEASRKSFKNSAEFETYLKGSGQTVAVMKAEIKLGKITDALFAKAKSKDHPPSPGEVAAFYEQHRQSFAIPAGRHVRILRTATEASALKAMSELRAGKSFAAVASELSAIAQPITAKNGEVKDLKPHLYEEKPLNDAIFNAKANRLYGPLRINAAHRTIASETNSGFFIFEVKGVVPGYRTPLSKVKASIAQQLEAQQKQQNLASFVAAFKRSWRTQTDCRPGYVLVSFCKQFKAPKGASAEDPYTL